MSTKSKYILFTIIICAMTIFIAGFECGKCENKKVEAIEKIEEVEEYVDVWTTTTVDIKKEPNENSETVGKYYWNVKVPVVYMDDAWAKIKDTGYYISRELTSETPIKYVNRDVPTNNTIKSYMDYRTITSTVSNQYKLQKYAYTDDNGVRMVNGRYCVVVGSYYTTTIGQYIDIELENGNVIQGILSDCKANKHTDSTNRINPNGSVLEFVVDVNSLNNTAKKMGDLSYINEWNSKIVNIKVYDKVESFK